MQVRPDDLLLVGVFDSVFKELADISKALEHDHMLSSVTVLLSLWDQ